MTPDDLNLYLDAGFILLETEGKVPTEQNWTAKQFNPKPSAKMLKADTFGVKLTDELLVIDDDPRNYKNNENSLDKLQQHIGYSLFNESKFVVQTGSGGHHFYFKKPKTLEVQENLPMYPGVEFKSVGRQVIGAGSIHPETKRKYTISFSSLTPKHIDMAPQKLLLLIAKKTTQEIKAGLTAYSDNDFDIRRCKEHVEALPPAVEGDGGDHQTYRVCAVGHDYGLSPDTFLPILRQWNDRCQPPWSDDELQVKLYNAYRYSQNGLGYRSLQMDFPEVCHHYDITEPEKTPEQEKRNITELEGSLDRYKGTDLPKPTFHNATRFFRLHPELINTFWFNEFTNCVVIRKPLPWRPTAGGDGVPVTDDDLNQLRSWFASKRKIEFAQAFIYDSLRQVAYERNRFHPVRDFLLSIAWDQTPRLSRWLPIYLGADDSPYVQAVGKKFLVAAVARVFEPGCKWDYMLHLEGKQGIGKSTTCKTLFSPWFTDACIDINEKDGVLLLQGHWGIEFGETASFRKAETEAQKSFMTRQTDKIRAPFDRLPREYPRQQVFISTTNHAIYTDETGNRRWWPVKVKKLVDRLFLDREQLWAEAYQCYLQKEKLYLDTPQLVRMAEDEQRLRYDEDAWTEQVAEFLQKQDGTILMHKIFEECLGRSVAMFSRSDQMRMAKILKTLGWERKSERNKETGEIHRVYERTSSTF